MKVGFSCVYGVVTSVFILPRELNVGPACSHVVLQMPYQPCAFKVSACFATFRVTNMLVIVGHLCG